MPKFLLILSLIFINTLTFAENTDIITYLDKRESQALKLEDNLTQTEEAIEGRLNQAELGIFYFEADSSDKLEKKEESDANYDKILAHYVPILDNPNSTKLQRLKALKEITKVKIRQDKYDEIIQICRELLYQYPQNLQILETEAEAHHLYANYCLSQGEYDNAIREYQIILDMNVSDIWQAVCKYNLANIYSLKGDDESAISFYKSIIQDHPNLYDWPALAQFSIAEYQLKRKKDMIEARETFQLILTNYPNSSWTKPALDKLRSLK